VERRYPPTERTENVGPLRCREERAVSPRRLVHGHAATGTFTVNSEISHTHAMCEQPAASKVVGVASLTIDEP
jgi:hypothetical protein